MPVVCSRPPRMCRWSTTRNCPYFRLLSLNSLPRGIRGLGRAGWCPGPSPEGCPAPRPAPRSAGTGTLLPAGSVRHRTRDRTMVSGRRCPAPHRPPVSGTRSPQRAAAVSGTRSTRSQRAGSVRHQHPGSVGQTAVSGTRAGTAAAPAAATLSRPSGRASRRSPRGPARAMVSGTRSAARHPQSMVSGTSTRHPHPQREGECPAPAAPAPAARPAPQRACGPQRHPRRDAQPERAGVQTLAAEVTLGNGTVRRSGRATATPPPTRRVLLGRDGRPRRPRVRRLPVSASRRKVDRSHREFP